MHRACRVAINQFNKALDKSQASALFKLLLKYQPEERKEKKERLLKEADARAAGQVRVRDLCSKLLKVCVLVCSRWRMHASQGSCASLQVVCAHLLIDFAGR